MDAAASETLIRFGAGQGNITLFLNFTCPDQRKTRALIAQARVSNRSFLRTEINPDGL